MGRPSGWHRDARRRPVRWPPLRSDSLGKQPEPCLVAWGQSNGSDFIRRSLSLQRCTSPGSHVIYFAGPTASSASSLSVVRWDSGPGPPRSWRDGGSGWSPAATGTSSPASASRSAGGVSTVRRQPLILEGTLLVGTRGGGRSPDRVKQCDPLRSPSPRAAHSARALTSAAGASSVTTFTQAPTRPEAAAAKRRSGP